MTALRRRSQDRGHHAAAIVGTLVLGTTFASAAATAADCTAVLAPNDAATLTAESGKIAKKKITGHTWNATAKVRSVCTCRPDRACDVAKP